MGFCVGHKHAENVKTLTTVPVQNRTCTDIPCCVVFLIFVIGFLAVTLWSFAMGDYALLLYPTDSHGRVCGRDVHDKPYLLFFDLIVCVKLGPSVVVTGCPTPQVCLSSCPNYSWSPDASNGDATRDSMICLDGVNANDPKFSGQSVQQLVRNGQCAPNVYPSKPVLNRCLPNQSFELTAIVTGQAHNNADKSMLLQNPDDPMVNGVKVSQDTFLFKLVTIWEKIVADLTQTWHIIVICILVSVVLSFIWIYLLRCCTAAIVWTTITLYVTLFTIGTVFCFLRWHKLSTTSESATYFESYSVMASYFRWAPTWLGLGIIFAILLGITLLILIFLRQRIHIAIAILREVSKAVSSNPSVPLLPILPFFLEMIVIVLVLLVAFSLSTISDPVGAKVINGSDPVMNLSLEDKAKKGIQDIIRLIPCNPLENSLAGEFCRFIYYGNRKYTIYLQMFNLFMFFWLINFLESLTQMALAGVFAEYYFTRFDRKPQLRCSSIRSLFRSIFYHSGSLAFGSFLIALLQWLRSVLEYLHIKLKKANNPIAAFFLKCFSCCFWLLEKCLRFINRNAFIMISIYGQNFCSASGSALSLLSRNLVRLVVVDKVTDFILFIGKLVIVGSVGGMAYIYLEGILIGLRPNLHYTFAPLCIIILCSYLVASLFSNVFETGVETTFLCFLEDLERNDGSAEKPYFMSTNLLQILGKYNRKPNGSHDKN